MSLTIKSKYSLFLRKTLANIFNVYSANGTKSALNSFMQILSSSVNAFEIPPGRQQTGYKGLPLIMAFNSLAFCSWWFHLEEIIKRFRRCHMVSCRANAADLLSQCGHFLRSPSLTELFKPSEIRHLQKSTLYIAFVIKKEGYLSVS